MVRLANKKMSEKNMDKKCRELYLNLMKRVLTNFIYKESTETEILSSRFPAKYLPKMLAIFNLKLLIIEPFNQKRRKDGTDWPKNAHTMIGTKRLNNLQFCTEEVIKKQIPGDLIETGVWRGGACIFMRAILEAYNIKNRKVWVADSFEGLPKADLTKYPKEEKVPFDTIDFLKVSLVEVKNNFKNYDLLDGQVCFLKGYFKDTLPKAPITKLALIRIDGDMYESTMDSLTNLYPKLSPGGFIIIDDFDDIKACRQAVLDYRLKHNIKEKIIKIDSRGAYWERE